MSKENPNELKIINKNERLKYINLLDKYKQQIADLEAKLAENRKWLASNEGFLENQKLKQQLAEKEKEIEDYQKLINDICNKYRVGSLKNLPIEFAIEKLKRLKEKALHFLVQNTEKLSGFYVDIEEIDNQIEKLKKE